MIRPLSLAALLFSPAVFAGEWIDLWPGKAPGHVPEMIEEVREGGRLSMIAKPQYLLYPTKSPSGSATAAVIIFPGGGYSHLAMNHEGHDYAKWLNERGITAILVKYRVSSKGGYEFPIPLIDARRAIRTARFRANDWNIDPDKIGVWGSSAGGHLASLCATQYIEELPTETHDKIDEISARPDFAILSYPVIIMDSKLGHSGSLKKLGGKNPSPELRKQLTTYHSVTKETPPVFVVHTEDDQVNVENSKLFAAALEKNQVPYELHLFPTGGHGYGLLGKGDLAKWPELLDSWLLENGWAAAQ